MNKITLIGNLVADPEQVETKSGKTTTSFRIAVNRRFSGPSGEKVTDFFTIKAWGKNGDNCFDYLKKGRKVAVVGELQARQYEGRDGTTRMALDVAVDDVEFLGKAEQDPAEEPKQRPKRKEPEVDFTDVQSDDIPF